MSTTIKRNNVGDLVSVVKPITKTPPSFDGQKYSAAAYLFDKELNEWVSFYWMTQSEYSDNGSGSQCAWLRNNAHVNNKDHFGIKLTGQNHGNGSAKTAALAMYQRQKLAAEHNLAPPVHGLCCVKVWNKEYKRVNTYWGYLTCRAELGAIGENPDSLAEFEVYVDELRQRWDRLDEIEELLDNTEWVPLYTQKSIVEDIRNHLDTHPDDISFYEWCYENEYDPLDIGSLKEDLLALDAKGLQHDFFPIGSKYPSHSFMGGDLHESNVALWNGNPVCIDFGYHCLGERNRWSVL